MAKTRPQPDPRRKRVPIDEVVVGMRILGLDQSWLKTPFFSHRLRVTSPDQIETLKASGVHMVDIEADAAPEEALAGERAPALPESIPPADPAAVAPVSSRFEDELSAAREAYREAKAVIAQAMHHARMGAHINTESVGRAVSGMVESTLRNPDALASLSRLKSFDQYTFYHSVNTTILALTLGRNLGMGRDALSRLGTGALLHDIGKMTIPLAILNKPGRFEPDEFEIMKQHALRGAEIISVTTGLPDEASIPALEHHERPDGSGYPLQRQRPDLSTFGLIASVVDIYDAITSDRVYHKAMLPYQALQLLYALGKRRHVELEMVERLIQCIGVYPVGSCVELNTGEIGVVTQVHAEAAVQPVVLVVADRDGTPRDPPVTVDLAAQCSKPVRHITAVRSPTELGIDPARWFTPLDAEG